MDSIVYIKGVLGMRLIICLFLLFAVTLHAWLGSDADVEIVTPIGVTSVVSHTPGNIYLRVYNSLQGISKFEIWLKDMVTLNTRKLYEQEYDGSEEVYIVKNVITSEDMLLNRNYELKLVGYDLNDDTWTDTNVIHRDVSNWMLSL